MKANGFDDKSKAQQISIDNNTYFLFTQKESNGKSLIIEFHNKDIIIRVNIIYPDLYQISSPEQYKNLFEKNSLEKFINGMVKLFQESG